MMEYYQSPRTYRHMPGDLKDSLEYDLYNTPWIVDKVKNSEIYAQQLYAALCDNDFQRLDIMTILADRRWHCSWRGAGGIVADMRGYGDYVDFYCSGIRVWDLSADENGNLMPEQQQRYQEMQNYVAEATVTDEIRADLKQMGWVVV